MNKPAPVRYAIWLSDILRGDMGISTSVSVFILMLADALLDGAGSLGHLLLFDRFIPADCLCRHYTVADLSTNFYLDLNQHVHANISAALFCFDGFALASRLLPIGGLTSTGFYRRDFLQDGADLKLQRLIIR